MTDPSPVRLSVNQGVAVLTFDNPPVNALSDRMRQALLDALKTLARRDDIAAVVLTGKGSAFIAGADIDEMDLPPERPFLPEVTDAIAAMTMPVIAAISGACLGGGTEIALACDYRIAAPGARIGLPETRLGIIPGAGGTQRLPRLVGLKQAITLICEAHVLKADAALGCGLVDAVADNPLVAAEEVWRSIAKRDLSAVPIPAEDERVLEALRERVSNRFKRSEPVLSVLDLMLSSKSLAFADGVRREREIFLRLRQSQSAKALRYLFKAERQAARLPEGAAIRKIERIGIAGGGSMGSGIALAFAQSGFPVLVFERDARAALAAQERLSSTIDALVVRGRLVERDAQACKRLVGFDHDLSPVANCDLLVEAVFEDYDSKRLLFERLAPHLRPGAIVASNTSYLDIDRLAADLPEPDNVLGMHFFAPANVMKLVEVIRGAETDPAVVASIVGVARRLGKVPVIAGNAEGFIGNRIFAAYRREMEYLVEDGADPKDVDEALEAFGFAMGPFSVFDMSGLDIAWAMRKRNAATRDPDMRYVHIPDRLCEAGLFGRKTGRGWYDHAADKRTVSPEAMHIIRDERQRKNIVPREIAADEIVSIALETMAREGAALVAEGVAQRPSDIDLVLVSGYGFPRDKGGPMFIASGA
jgi:3-hydroxyacyl-CoA dehydrogenase